MYMQDRFYSHIESKCILTFKDVIEINILCIYGNILVCKITDEKYKC